MSAIYGGPKPLEGVPTAKRGSQLVVPSSHATGAELQVIKDALDNLPTKVSCTSMVSSVLSSLILMGKIFNDSWANGHFSAGLVNLGLFIAAAIVGGLAIQTYFVSKHQKTPLQDRAKAYVQRLIDEQPKAETVPITDQP